MAYVQFINQLTNQRKRIANVSFYLAASMIQLIIGLVTSPMISKALTHRDFAIVGYFNSFLVLFTPLVGLMLGSYYARTYFRITSDKREKLKNTVMSLLLTHGVCSTFVILGIFLVFIRISDPGFSFYPYAVLSFGTMVFGQLYNFYLLTMRLSKKAKGYFYVSLFHHVFYGLMMITLCVVFRYGAAGSLAATLITSSVFSFYCINKLDFRYQIDKEILKQSLRFCWPLIIAGCLQYFFSGVDRALLAGMRDDVNLGLYSIAFRITSYIGVFYAAISMTIEPDIYNALARRRYQMLAFLLVALFLFKLGIVLVFNILAPYIVDLLTAGRYTRAVPYARILSFKNLSSSLYSSMSLIIIGLGYSKVTLANRIVGTAGVFVMFNVLISKYGFVGAAWGQVLSYIILSMLSLMFLVYKLYNKNKSIG